MTEHSMKTLSFTIPISPRPKARHRDAKYGGKYNPSAKLEKEIATFCSRFKQPILSNGPIILRAKFYRKRKVISTPDLDNYLKLLKDSLNGVLWKDDSQIIAYKEHTGKYYSEEERMEVRIDYLQEDGK